MQLPKEGLAADDILQQLDTMKSEDVDYAGGRVFSLAYSAGEDVNDLAKAAHNRFLSANGLNMQAFPSLRRMQAEVVGMVADLLHGGNEAAGFITSGGTESLLLSVKAARERGWEQGIDAPEMVLPTTAHAAFEKGAKYFGVKSVRIPVGDDFKADPEAMRAAVNENTVLVVGSAPNYPQGVIDPIEALGEIALEHDCNCHIDGCMGGMILPMMERLGDKIPLWDFRVPGVTSISADLHKYGYTAKGASVLLHRNRELRKHQTFLTENWLGGVYGSPGVLGTKSGGPIAAAWAVMNYIGEAGYLRLTKIAREAATKLMTGLRETQGIQLVGNPEVTLIAFTFDELDAFAVGEQLRIRGWHVDQQKPPPSLHCMVNAVHEHTIEAFLDDLREVMSGMQSGQTAEQQAYGTTE
ncbi:MAG: aspartate aminotransferase family protein [Pseudomonadota bacterium]